MPATRRTQRAPRLRSAGTPGRGAPPVPAANDAEVRALVGLELASMRASAALRDWMLEIHRRAGGPTLGARDVLLLHGVRAFDRPQSLSELRRFTHARALPPLRASLTRLCGAGLLRSTRGAAARDPTYALTVKGTELVARCDALRDQVLVTLCRGERDLFDAMGVVTSALERLVGLYGQATRYVADLSVLDGSNPYTRDAP